MEFIAEEGAAGVSRADKKAMVEMVVSGISPYISTPLIRSAKKRSIFNVKNHFLVARTPQSKRDSLSGFLMYRIEKGVCFLYEIHVRADKQGLGIGSRLLAHLLSRQNRVILFVHRQNTRAQALYARSGFKYEKSYESRLYFSMMFHRKAGSSLLGGAAASVELTKPEQKRPSNTCE